MKSHLAPLAVLLPVLTWAAFAQPSAGPFSLAGTVTNSQTGEPIHRAFVQIVSQRPSAVNNSIPSVFTDVSGAFQWDGLPPGDYLVLARKPQFDPKDSPASVELVRSTADLKLKLSPLSVVTGKVTDRTGSPVRQVRVMMLSTAVERGFRRIRTERSASTDDRGPFVFGMSDPASISSKPLVGPPVLTLTPETSLRSYSRMKAFRRFISTAPRRSILRPAFKCNPVSNSTPI